VTNLSNQDLWRLDRTFNILFIIVILVIAPAVSIYVFREEVVRPAVVRPNIVIRIDIIR